MDDRRNHAMENKVAFLADTLFVAKENTRKN
jgi:hypothetical protein